MQYSIAFAAIMATAFAGTTIPAPAYGGSQETSHAMTTPVATTSAPAGPKTSTAFVTDVETILSCGPEVTSCPGRTSTATPVTTAPATSKPITSQAPPASTSVVVIPPPVMTTPVATSSKPVTTAPATSQAPPAPPVPVLSTQAIETCVPTTIYKTVTVNQPVSSAAVTTPVATTIAQVTTPVATSKAPYGTGAAPVYGGSPSGTGVGPKPSTTAPIQQGAASSLQISGGLALVAAAALLF